MTKRVEGKIAVVVGAGQTPGETIGNGVAIAQLLAREGATVLCVDRSGERAEKTAKDISSAGAVVSSMEADITVADDCARIVKLAMTRYGRIDILIANAGILRDKTLTKMELADFEAVMQVHVWGTFKPIKAVWDIMKAQNYGRIVVTTSSSGMYGNFGQSNYGAAKMAVLGLMNTLKLEGQKNNIHINAISPVAATRMTEGLMPPEVLAKLAPEAVTPGVVYLVSDEAPTGAILTAGAGAFALSRIYETEGVYLSDGELSAEGVRDHWGQITAEDGQKAYFNGGEQGQKFFRKMAGG